MLLLISMWMILTWRLCILEPCLKCPEPVAVPREAPLHQTPSWIKFVFVDLCVKPNRHDERTPSMLCCLPAREGEHIWLSCIIHPEIQWIYQHVVVSIKHLPEWRCDFWCLELSDKTEVRGRWLQQVHAYQLKTAHRVQKCWPCWCSLKPTHNTIAPISLGVVTVAEWVMSGGCHNRVMQVFKKKTWTNSQGNTQAHRRLITGDG